MKLYIKNMVCDRCKMVVKSELEKLGLHVLSLELGEVEVENSISQKTKLEINKTLQQFGFALIDDKKSKIIEKIKTLIIELIYTKSGKLVTNFSDFLTEHLNKDYNSVSRLFSEVEGITIEKYFIAQKIERVKELLVYDELSLTEIADQLNYSSVAHLSAQFKKVTGFTPSYFKEIKEKKRSTLDAV